MPLMSHPQAIVTIATLYVAIVVGVISMGHRLKRFGVCARTLRLILGIFGVLGLVGVALFYFGGFNLDQHGTVFWSLLSTGTVVLGVLASIVRGTVPTLELGIGIGVVMLHGMLLAGFSGVLGLSHPATRILLSAPAVLGLGSYFGASLGYLIWGAGRADPHLDYEFTVGRRYLISKASPVLSTVTSISVVGVMLGVWLVLLALGVLSGFEHDLQRKIIGANAHIVLEQNGGRVFELNEKTLDIITQVPGVTGAGPFVRAEAALASGSNYGPAVVYGIDPKVVAHVLDVLAPPLYRGSLDSLASVDDTSMPDQDPDADAITPPSIPHVVVGLELQKTLSVAMGTTVRMVSPMLETLSPLGPIPKSQSVQLSAIFSSQMYDFDARFVYMPLKAARNFFELPKNSVTGVQVRVDEPNHADRIAESILAALGQQSHVSSSPWEARDWKRSNQTLFAALKLERVVAFIVLAFIIMVASFSIVNTLTMSVIEKHKEIAILKTMGAHDAGIMKVFLTQGLLVGGLGIIIGTALAIGSVVALETFGFWIPTDVYYIESLPVHLEAGDVGLVVLAAVLIVWVFAVFPALRGSRLRPVEGLRDG